MSATACVRCGHVKAIRARGLCESCYMTAHRNGTLIDHPRKSLTRDEFMEEFGLLHDQGFTRLQIAERLGMTKDAVDKRLERIQKSERQETAA